MKLGLRVFFGYFCALGFTAWVTLIWIERELRPLVRQASEEALVETAYALAASVQPSLAATGKISREQVDAFSKIATTTLSANIWGNEKKQLNLNLSITDAQGIVLFDTDPANIGKDFSQWNDVYLTLQDRYGVRSSRTNASNEASTVMHVAAPIKKDDHLIGVLTVAMPSHSTQVYLEQSRANLHLYGIVILCGSLFVGVLFTWWLIRSLRRISQYAEHAADRDNPLPQFAKGTELEKLTVAIDHMRDEIEGHHHLENYIHHLTHELKGPLSAIRASNELLADEDMTHENRVRFVNTVEVQCDRLQNLADRLLQLIRLEKKRGLESREEVNIPALLRQEVLALQPQAKKRDVQFALENASNNRMLADRFLLTLALRNLLENALQFADTHSVIEVTERIIDEHVHLGIKNQGPRIPDYALPRLGERFYSLPHPDGSKGTGLGLAFVREIAHLHGGSFYIVNHELSVTATLILPQYT